jgi:hypothetical protein
MKWVTWDMNRNVNVHRGTDWYVVTQKRSTDSVKSVWVVAIDQAPAACIGDFLVGLLAKSEHSSICEVDNCFGEDTTRLPLSERGLLSL